MPSLSESLRREYEQLYHTCAIRPNKLGAADAIVDKIQANQQRYQHAAAAVQIPWHVVAVIHSMEASLSFTKHLHNGDPLTARTVHVPAGRIPPPAQPPFSWEESAADALKFDGMANWHDWSLAGTLFKLEGFNGFGYRMKHPNVLTPYLWSFSNHFTKGKFVGDGQFDPDAPSSQCGAAVLLKRMEERGLIMVGGMQRVKVTLNGAPSGIPALLDRSNTFIGIRGLTSALGGNITSTTSSPFAVGVQVAGQNTILPGFSLDGTGYVDFTDAMAALYPARAFTFAAGTNTLDIQ